MTPATAVARLAELVAGQSDFSEDDVYAAMAKAGLPDAVADRAYKFTQTAWARAFLADMGVRFPPDYLCFNARGDVIESGQLDQNEYYSAALQLVPQYGRTPGFKGLVQMAADVNAVNNALRAGSKPENLAMGVAAFFMEAPTQAGMARAQQTIIERLQAGSARAKVAAKPWWKFW